MLDELRPFFEDLSRGSFRRALTDNRVFRAWFRAGYPSTPRQQALIMFNNVFLHLHPVRIRRESLRITYTFCLGGLSFFLFLLLTITGVLLMFYYRPATSVAYQDMKDLDTLVNFGLLLRNMHRYSAHAMVIVVFLHMLRVFYTGAYRPPREFNWAVGAIPAVLHLLPQLHRLPAPVGPARHLGRHRRHEHGGRDAVRRRASPLPADRRLRDQRQHARPLVRAARHRRAACHRRPDRRPLLADPQGRRHFRTTLMALDKTPDMEGMTPSERAALYKQRAAAAGIGQPPEYRRRRHYPPPAAAPAPARRRRVPPPRAAAPRRGWHRRRRTPGGAGVPAKVAAAAAARREQVAAVATREPAAGARRANQSAWSTSGRTWSPSSSWSAILLLLSIVVVSIILQAPLEGHANADKTPNPSKAPWYFLNLQELLLHMHPSLAGVLIPAGVLFGAIPLIPYFDRNTADVGKWFGTPKAAPICWFTTVYTDDRADRADPVRRVRRRQAADAEPGDRRCTRRS